MRSVPVICLHGPESVGKSVLAAALAAHFHTDAVPEYGRDYCAEHGTDLTMADLLTIAQVQTDLIAKARARAGRLVIADTDALMTAVWADMMLGRRDPWFGAWNDSILLRWHSNCIDKLLNCSGADLGDGFQLKQPPDSWLANPHVVPVPAKPSS